MSCFQISASVLEIVHGAEVVFLCAEMLTELRRQKEVTTTSERSAVMYYVAHAHETGSLTLERVYVPRETLEPAHEKSFFVWESVQLVVWGLNPAVILK